MNQERKASKVISVSISKEDYSWLQEHKEISPSRLLQKCIAELRGKMDPGKPDL